MTYYGPVHRIERHDEYKHLRADAEEAQRARAGKPIRKRRDSAPWQALYAILFVLAGYTFWRLLIVALTWYADHVVGR